MILIQTYWHHNTDNSLAWSVRGTCQYPFKTSNVVTYLALPTLSMQSSTLGSGKEFILYDTIQFPFDLYLVMLSEG